MPNVKTNIIVSRIQDSHHLIEEQIGPFGVEVPTRRQRSRRQPGVIIVAEDSSHYEATLHDGTGPEFAPGLTIRCLITT